MTKEVIVDINSIISAETGTEKISTSSKGTCIQRNGEIYIFYEEGTAEEGKNKSRIKISGGIIELKKQGNSNTLMMFDVGNKTNMTYITPFGTMHFTVDTKDILTEIAEEKILIKLKYALLSEDRIVSEYDMNIKIEPDL